MSNWISRKCASIYESHCESRGYERLEGKERDRLEELAGDNPPHEIWIGNGKSQAWFKNVVINRRDYESYRQSEIEAVFLHEVGHVRDKASYKIPFLFMVVIIVAIFFRQQLFSTPPLYVAGLMRVSSIPIMFTLGLIWLFIISILILSVLGTIYKRYEYGADEYATSSGYGEELISVLQDRKRELGIIQNPKYYLIDKFFYPSIELRIERIRQNMNQ